MVRRTLLISAFIAFSITTLLAYPGEVVQQFASPGKFATGMTFDGESLWIADYKEDKLFAVNPKTGELIRSIPSPGFWPTGLAWDGEYLWNADSDQDKIFKVDTKDGTILKTISAPGSDPEGLTWDGTTLWITDSRSDELMKIDLDDGTDVETYPAPANYPQGLTFDGTYFWMSDRIKDEIHMVDPANGEVIIVTKSPGAYPRGLAWDGEHLWNLDYQTDSLYQIIRKDDPRDSLENTRKSEVTLTHRFLGYGNGAIQQFNAYFALPENLPQQKIGEISYTPEITNKVSDRWDQTFAHFQYSDISPNTPVNSVMKVTTEMSEIHYYVFPDRCGTMNDIPKDIKTTYTADGSKYDLEHPFIQRTTKEVVGDETNPYWVARNIFDYVRETLEYKLVGGWNVAPVVLQRGTGSCSEYTFSFIALCRAAGLPARYVGSVVVRGDDASFDDVFHRWPEVYLPNYGWIPMDPQGGDDPLPRDRAMAIGHLSNRFLITTQGAGDSEYMGWYYNAYETYVTDPQVEMNIETFGEWEPVE